MSHQDTSEQKSFENWLIDLAREHFENNGLQQTFRDRLGMSAEHSDEIAVKIRAMLENEKNHYEDPSEVPTEIKAKASLGSRKISSALLQKLIDKRIFTSDHKDVRGVSHSCIDTIIYLCCICDTTGYIPNFKISSLVGVTCDSERGAYYALHKLEEKDIIKIDCYCKNGFRDITVLHNDFSHYKKDRYLNLNRQFFNVNDHSERGYNSFRSLSLYAKKLLLYLLFQYDAQGGKRGYRGDIKKLSSKLGLKNNLLIISYVEELKPLCQSYKSLLEGWDSDIHTYKSKKTGSNDIIVSLRADRCNAEPNLLPNAPTCLKYRIESIFNIHSIPMVDMSTYKELDCDGKQLIYEKLAGLITWNATRWRDTPITVTDILSLCEDFIVECQYFALEHVAAVKAYITEFVRLSRSIILPNHILA